MTPSMLSTKGVFSDIAGRDDITAPLIEHPHLATTGREVHPRLPAAGHPHAGDARPDECWPHRDFAATLGLVLGPETVAAPAPPQIARTRLPGWVGVIALAQLGILLATSTRYGYHRDGRDHPQVHGVDPRAPVRRNWSRPAAGAGRRTEQDHVQLRTGLPGGPQSRHAERSVRGIGRVVRPPGQSACPAEYGVCAFS